MAQEGSGALKHDHRRDASPTALQPYSHHQSQAGGLGDAP